MTTPTVGRIWGIVTRQKTDDTHPDSPDFPQQRGCARGRSQQHQCFGADRLKYPMKRVGKRGENKFERISWEEALDFIASEMKRLMDEYGPESFFFHYASGTQWRGPDGRAPIRRLMRLFGVLFAGMSLMGVAAGGEGAGQGGVDAAVVTTTPFYARP